DGPGDPAIEPDHWYHVEVTLSVNHQRANLTSITEAPPSDDGEDPPNHSSPPTGGPRPPSPRRKRERQRPNDSQRRHRGVPFSRENPVRHRQSAAFQRLQPPRHFPRVVHHPPPPDLQRVLLTLVIRPFRLDRRQRLLELPDGDEQARIHRPLLH